jgi:hypothetical protein
MQFLGAAEQHVVNSAKLMNGKGVGLSKTPGSFPGAACAIFRLN